MKRLFNAKGLNNENPKVNTALIWLLCGWSVMAASLVHANSVTVNVQNATPEVLLLVSSYPPGHFPMSIAPGQTAPVSFDIGGTSSEVTSTYRRARAGTACRCSASHVVHVSGPRFNKSAVSTGTTSATCLTFQSPTWRIPYNYTATFAFYH